LEQESQDGLIHFMCTAIAVEVVVIVAEL